MARTIARDHEAKRRRILKTAAAVFADAGVSRASMAQVARACGISKANIYHYYDSKDALLFDILDTYLSALRDRVCTERAANLPVRARLQGFVTDLLLAYEGMDAEHQIQSQGLPLLPSSQQDILKSYQRDMVAALRDILCEARPEIFTQNGHVLHATTMSVFGMANWFYMWNSKADRADRIAYAKLITALVLDGVSGLGTQGVPPANGGLTASRL